MGRPEVIARRQLNGYTTEVLSTHAEAEREGWEVTRVLVPKSEAGSVGKPAHKKIEAPSAPEPVSDGNSEEEEQTYEDLYEQAQDLEIRGRSKMDKDQLAEAVHAARAGER